MEMFLDKNGTYLQRRKMYNAFPLHNMKSHLKFDWTNDDPSIQDQMGKKYNLAKERDQIRKKYSEIVDKKLLTKYGQLHEEQLSTPQIDTLAKQVSNFNHSKLSSSTNPYQHPIRKSDYHPHPQQLNHSYDNFNQPQPHYQYPNTGSPINRREPQQNIHPHPYIYKGNPYTNPHDQSYNPQNYFTLNTSRDRYRPTDEPNVQLGNSAAKFIQKMHTGTVINQYPFRNVIPDKLQTHLRERTKADRVKAVKVNLNLFDYYTKK